MLQIKSIPTWFPTNSLYTLHPCMLYRVCATRGAKNGVRNLFHMRVKIVARLIERLF